MLNDWSREPLGKKRNPKQRGKVWRPSNFVGDPYECLNVVSDK